MDQEGRRSTETIVRHALMIAAVAVGLAGVVAVTRHPTLPPSKAATPATDVADLRLPKGPRLPDGGPPDAQPLIISFQPR